MAVETIRSESTSIRETPDEFILERFQLLVMERLDLTRVMQVPDDELPAQIGEIVGEIFSEAQNPLNGSEHDQILNLVISDIMERRTKIQNKMAESGATRTQTSPGKRS